MKEKDKLEELLEKYSYSHGAVITFKLYNRFVERMRYKGKEYKENIPLLERYMRLYIRRL